MRDLIFRLDAERCTDGVERIRRDGLPGVKGRSYGKVWFSWRSDRHAPVVRQATDLRDPLVTGFLNASNGDKLVKFLSAFGLPNGFLLSISRGSKKHFRSFSLEALPKGLVLGASGVGFPAEPQNFVRAMQRGLRHLLEDAASGNAARKDKAAQRALHFVSESSASAVDGRLALTAPTLIAFMHFEVYMTVENGAYIGRCKRCGDLFLYGKGTKRRNTATYCSGRCRTSAHRATKRGS
jgi:hypothetical protein